MSPSLSLRGVEESLAEIAQQQNTNVEQLVNIVNENQSILNEMKTNLKQTFVAAVASIVIQSDVDGNMKIDLKELAILTLRLQAHLEPLGLELDTHKFEAMIKEDNGNRLSCDVHLFLFFYCCTHQPHVRIIEN